MTRSERLLRLLDVLRRHRRAVSGRTLADETGVSLRTLYRDIASLQAQGADIQGEAGVGYVLKPGFMLPPLMFSENEIEAMVLGARWVSRNSDEQLGSAARNAMAKVAAVLPADLRQELETSTLLVGAGERLTGGVLDLALVRESIRRERKLDIRYRDKDDAITERTVWPFALGFFDRVRVIVAWCELRQGFRHFRVDRVEQFQVTDIRYPRRRLEMLGAWKAEQEIKREAR